MKIHMTGRQIEVTQALRQATEDRLARLAKYLDGNGEAHVILAVEKRRHRAEIVVRDRRVTLSAAAETNDMYSTLNLVGDRLERQAKKRREKVKIERKREGKKASTGWREREKGPWNSTGTTAGYSGPGRGSWDET